MPGNCQVQTPNEYVEKMLDYLDYRKDLYGKSVLENSCGEGNILKCIVERYIDDARAQGIIDSEIVKGLEHNIIGYEKDPKCIRKCKENLDTLTYEKKLSKVSWNIKKQDYLKSKGNLYDYIIGNPPYITYHDLTEKERKWLRDNFISCHKGRCDYYYAFVEKSVFSLKPTGKMAYLIPFNIFRNKYAKDLRNIIKQDLKAIYDYSGIKVFPNVIISSTVVVLDKQSNSNDVFYCQVKENNETCISKSDLREKWFFSKVNKTEKRFGDYFTVNNSVATLFNAAFIVTDYKEDERYTYVNQHKIENELLLEAVSTKTIKSHMEDKKKDKIIFPYKLTSKGYEKYEEDDFLKLYPEAYKYMNSFSDKLKERKADKFAKWYEYGRSQAIGEINGEKLILPMVITQRVKLYMAGKKTVPYAGYFIKKKQNSPYSLSDAKKILESADFYEYVKEHGTPTTSTSYRISVKEIADYFF
jgi:methylase of polypeptide subunit release factors